VFDLPVINGQGTWYSDNTYIIYDEPEQPAGENIPGQTGFTVTEEVVQLLEVEAAEQSVPIDPASFLSLTGSSNPDDWFYFGFTLDSRSDFVRSGNDMSALMEAQGVPDANRRYIASYLRTEDEFEGEFEAKHKYLADRIESRVNQRGKPTLFVLINGHHLWDANTERPSGFNKVLLRDGKNINREPFDWKLREFKACKVVVVWETCFSELLAKELKQHFEISPPNARPSLKVFAASAEDEPSRAKALWQEVASLGYVRAGGLFVSEFVDNATIVDGDYAGVTTAEGKLIPSLDLVHEGFIYDQHGKLVVSQADPLWCETLESVVVLDKSELVFQSPDSETIPCSRIIGSFQVSSQTEQDVEVVITSSHPAVQLDPSKFTITGKRSRTVFALFNCSVPPPVNATLTVVATAEYGYRDTTEVDVHVLPPGGKIEKQFTIRAPGIAKINNYQLWHNVPAGAVVDSMRLIDTATGEDPPVFPWPQSTAAFSITYEGINPQDASQHGIEFKLDDFFGAGCPECPLLTWRHTLWYSYRAQDE